MEGKLPLNWHFFKIMMPGHNTKLPLPKAFCQKLNGRHPEMVNITTCKGTWDVKIEKNSSDLLSFGRGWRMFAREHDLSMGDVVVLEHCGDMHFTATILDLTACNKFPVNSTNKKVTTTEEESTKTSASDSSHFITAITTCDVETACRVDFCGRRKKDDHPRGKPTMTSASDCSHFTKAITACDIRYHFSQLYIPQGFTRAHGLVQKKRIILKDSTGVNWPVALAYYTRNRAAMVKGWSDFCLAKNIKIGDTCTFSFRESPHGCDFVLMDMENKLLGSQHFYKIMMPGFNTELPLPKAVCEKLIGQHSELATITSCKGTWEVKAAKNSSGLISFARGWSMFAREHDLSLGDFIVFEHCGNMRFTATMFDLTACEKKFPVNSTNKIDQITDRAGFCGRHEKDRHAREEPTKTRTSDSSHFTTVITPLNVRRQFNTMYISKPFARAHGLGRKKSIILRDSSGKEWPIVLAHYTEERVEMTTGWSDFCLQNDLKVGDTCTFQFRDSPDLCMDVSISRASEMPLTIRIYANVCSYRQPLPRAFCRKLEGEHSEVAIISSCKGKWEVNVEKSSSDLVSFAEGWDIFAREHELRSGDLIVFEHIGNMHFTATVYDLTACEKDFSVNSTNKKHGVHSRVDGPEMKHKKEEEKQRDGLEKKHKKGEEKRRKTNASEHKGSPYFTSVMKPHSITHDSPCKYIPIAFWKAHGLDKKKTIILRDSMGDEWPVGVLVTTSERVGMRKGWSAFYQSHNLEVGDVCTFTLREISDHCNDSVTLDVSISRRRKEDFF
ncbi:hypothetical protein Leryth_008138 [Lithospermum erythrorhizon]|nr:hypothetical protein Leryth_008138 [Lithospermum erythrorhizon]